MIIQKHHFTNAAGHKVAVYWYEDRYRYTITTERGIEYREMFNILDLIQSVEDLEMAVEAMSVEFPYGEQQYKSKCIRCSKHNGAPRLYYNSAPICNRCYSAMEQTDDISVSDAHVWYSINEDGSKGSVIK
jgi:hypothetical protein